MAPEEAIKTIQVTIVEVEWNYPLDYAIAFETAINALEKQIPKKPAHSGNLYACSNCKRFIRKNVMIPYCKWCGQALDWGDDK